MARPRPSLENYLHTMTIQTRWHDNDIYGHVNNAVYYFYFDTVVNSYLIDQDVLALGKSDIVGLVVETGCAYHAPISYPDVITAGLRVAHIGTSSVRYEIGLFRNQDTLAAAHGHFVHVYVDEPTRRPRPLRTALRSVLEKIQAAS